MTTWQDVLSEFGIKEGFPITEEAIDSMAKEVSRLRANEWISRPERLTKLALEKSVDEWSEYAEKLRATLELVQEPHECGQEYCGACDASLTTFHRVVEALKIPRPE